MTWASELAIDDMLAFKPKGFFRIETVEGRTLCTVSRPGEPTERFLCFSPGHANQVRMALSDEGLTGFCEGAL